MTKLNHFISLDFSAAPIERVKLLIQNQNELLKQGKLQQVRKKKKSVPVIYIKLLGS